MNARERVLAALRGQGPGENVLVLPQAVHAYGRYPIQLAGQQT
jgi:hypothetical protein